MLLPLLLLFCNAILLLLLQQQCCFFVLPVRHLVPGCQICRWFIESSPSVFFLFIQTRCIFYVPLGSTVSHLRPRFAYILGNYGHARSQGGRQPAAAKPPLYKHIHAYIQTEKKKNLTLNRLCFIDKQYFARACCLQLYGRNPVRKRIL